MKVLFLANYNGVSPHFETLLELISKHIDNGDEIFILTCSGVLDICPSNIKSSKVACLLCKQRFFDGLNCLNQSKIKIFKLKNIKYKKFSLLPILFNNIENLKNFEIDGVDFGLAVASSLISDLRDHNFDTLLYKNRINKMLKASICIYENMFFFLRYIKPDITYIYNGRFAFDRPAIRACQKLKFDFITYDMNMKGYVNLKNGFSLELKDIKKQMLDFWEDKSETINFKKEIAEKWFLSLRGGAGRFRKEQVKGLMLSDFNNSKRNIVFFNSSQDEFECLPRGVRKGLYNNEIEVLLDLMEFFQDDPNYMFYLRVHPNLKNLDNTQIRNLKKFASYNYKNLKIIWPEEKFDSYVLLENCEKVIVFNSTMGVEACFWNKPSILVGVGLYEDLDCCYKPKTKQEFFEMIRSNLFPKKRINAFKYAYWSVKRFIKFKDFDSKKCEFKGKKLRYNINLKNRFLLSYYSRLDKLKNIKFFNKED